VSKRIWVVAVLLGVALVWLLWLREDSPAPPQASPEPALAAERVEPPADAPSQAEWSDDASASQSDSDVVELDPDWERAFRWALIDLDDVREQLPDNLYWKMSQPTEDEELIDWRAQERARWNEDFGKVLSGNATPEEVNGYFDMRERISEDAVLFSDHLIQEYREVLPERDLGMLHLARRLHMARLQEFPRKRVEALERSLRQDELRAQWLADEEAFESALEEDRRRDADTLR